MVIGIMNIAMRKQRNIKQEQSLKKIMVLVIKLL